jgi:hypothetical protein
MHDLPLPKASEGTILASQRSEIRRMSDKNTRRDRFGSEVSVEHRRSNSVLKALSSASVNRGMRVRRQEVR